MIRFPWQARPLPSECPACKSHRGVSGNVLTAACGAEDVRIGRFRRCADCRCEFYVLDDGRAYLTGGAQRSVSPESEPVGRPVPPERPKGPEGMSDMKMPSRVT